MKIGITKMSSKGQVVIPKELRDIYKPDQKLLVVREGNNLLLKREEDVSFFSEDFDYLNQIESEYKKLSKQKLKAKSKDEFLDELEKW